MKTKLENRRGAMVVLVAVTIIILLIGAVFTVDVAYMHMVRAELRTATDAAARAGSEVLSRTQDPDAARAAAIAVAELNSVAGNGLTIAPSDIQVGSVTGGGAAGRFTFVNNAVPFTAVRVIGSRVDSSADGSVPLFFARVFSIADFEPVQSATASANIRDLALVLDVSLSMAEKSGGVTRLKALQDAVNVFLDEVTVSSPMSLLSLVSYSTTPTKILNLTDDFEAVRDEVNNFKPIAYTAIGTALTMGSDSLVNDPLNRDFAFKTVILMTDGNHNTGPSPMTTVATAAARGQTVHTITFSNEANQNLMRSVAQATPGGIHIHADGSEDLAAAFRAIARSLAVTLIE